MGDSASAAPDKAKEKKKKKVGSVKEKEPRKKSGTESDLQPEMKSMDPESLKEQPKAAEFSNENPASETPTNPTSAATEGTKKSKKVKSSAKPDETAAPEASAEERKASVTEDAVQKASPAEETSAARDASHIVSNAVEEGATSESAGIQNNEQPIQEEPLEPMPPIGGSYVVPPAATKKDVDLLQDLDENKLRELKEAFELFDYNQDGFIDYKDLKLTYQSLGYTDVPDDDISNMLAEAISPLDFDAFVILLGYKTIEMDPEAILIEALACWDYDNSGLISEDRIKHDLMTWGDKFTSEEVEQALEDAPVYVNKKGVTMIDYHKFSNTLCGLRKKTKPMELNPESYP